MARVKGSAVTSRVRYVRERFGEAAYRRLRDALLPAESELLDGRVLPSGWVPYSLFLSVNVEADRLFGKGDLALCFEMAKFGAEVNLPTLYRLFYRFNKPRFIFEQAARLWDVHYDTGRLVPVLRGRSIDDVHPHRGLRTTAPRALPQRARLGGALGGALGRDGHGLRGRALPNPGGRRMRAAHPLALTAALALAVGAWPRAAARADDVAPTPSSVMPSTNAAQAPAGAPAHAAPAEPSLVIPTPDAAPAPTAARAPAATLVSGASAQPAWSPPTPIVPVFGSGPVVAPAPPAPPAPPDRRLDASDVALRATLGARFAPSDTLDGALSARGYGTSTPALGLDLALTVRAIWWLFLGARVGARWRPLEPPNGAAASERVDAAGVDALAVAELRVPLGPVELAPDVAVGIAYAEVQQGGFTVARAAPRLALGATASFWIVDPLRIAARLGWDLYRIADVNDFGHDLSLGGPSLELALEWRPR